MAKNIFEKRENKAIKWEWRVMQSGLILHTYFIMYGMMDFHIYMYRDMNK